MVHEVGMWLRWKELRKRFGVIIPTINKYSLARFARNNSNNFRLVLPLAKRTFNLKEVKLQNLTRNADNFKLGLTGD